jgi:hypothetical protein
VTARAWRETNPVETSADLSSYEIKQKRPEEPMLPRLILACVLLAPFGAAAQEQIVVSAWRARCRTARS